MRTFIASCLCLGLVLASSENTEDDKKRFILSFGTSSCSDSLDNCAAYDSNICTSYRDWAKTNCQSTCNLCSDGGSPSVPQIPQPVGGGGSTSCSDKLSNCNSYDPSVCSNAMYKQWATDNCAKTCHLCSGGSTGGGMPSTGTGTGTGSGGTMTGSSSGCYYNNQLYQQGQSWNDGCKYKCRCTDGSAGKYECRQLCLNWDLPAACRMDPPAAGKCCPKPNCPSYIVLQYPQGYVEE